jgi:hypothetical protein
MDLTLAIPLILAAFAAGYLAGRRGLRAVCPFVAAALTAAQSAASPQEAYALALADAKAMGADKAYYTEWLDCTHLTPEGRADAAKVLAFWVNSLSREPDIVIPRQLAGGAVLAIDCRDYGMDVKTFWKFGDPEAKEPYFHVIAEVEQTYHQLDQYGRQQASTRKVRQTYQAPWLGKANVEALYALTKNPAPVLRADWFFNQTAVAKDRHVGYYDLLGLGKKEADFQRLIGANATEAKRLKLELAATVAASGVTLNNRGIVRQQALAGAYWFTQDYKTSVDKQNTARLLAGDTEPPAGDASEQYGALPNGLFAFWLQNDKAERQDAAPDFIASDSKSTSNDRRVHAGLSCVRCHVEGLRPINDHARGLFRGPLQLKSPDYDKLKRLRQLYGSDLPRQLEADNARFAASVKACNGLEVGANAKLVGGFWEQYADQPVDIGRAAAELGCDAEKLVAAVQLYARGAQVFDPVIAAFAQVPPQTVRREHWEEVYPQMVKLAGSAGP